MKELLLYHGSKIKHMNTCVHMNKLRNLDSKGQSESSKGKGREN